MHIVTHLRRSWERTRTAEKRLVRKDAGMAQLDNDIGLGAAKAPRTWEDDETIVVFSTDNGTSFTPDGGTTAFAQSRDIMEGGSGVPAILRGPARYRGTVARTHMSGMDGSDVPRRAGIPTSPSSSQGR